MSTRHDDTASLVDPGSQKRIDEVADALRRRGGSATSAELASDWGFIPRRRDFTSTVSSSRDEWRQHVDIGRPGGARTPSLPSSAMKGRGPIGC